jgi:hypothetical protein
MDLGAVLVYTNMNLLTEADTTTTDTTTTDTSTTFIQFNHGNGGIQHHNYPNPFSRETVIEYHLEKVSEIELVIYNMLGRKLETLVSGLKPAGRNSVSWDASDYPDGLYFYRIKAGQKQATGKLLFSRNLQ